MTAIDRGRYQARLRRTEHGVAHIEAPDLGALAFAQGYACASDHIGIIADQVLKVRGERARWFGRGTDDSHVNSDFGYHALGVASWADRMEAEADEEILEAVTGYAAGINHWLTTVGQLPKWCEGAPWVRPVSVGDMFRLYADAALMASGRNLASALGSAQPPGSPPVTSTPMSPEPTPGSNGWAFGADATRNGRGLVVANPHFPWYGDGRFWECHLVIPGELDVYGVSLIGTPGVQIGFNADVAWTHTFSRGHRFVIYQLELDPNDPTRYRHGDEWLSMTAVRSAIEVAQPDGHPVTEERLLWRTHLGPVVDVPLLGWSPMMAFVLADANDQLDSMIPQYLAFDRATSVADLRAAAHRHQGLPWVNVIAADRHGEVWYSDPSTTPDLADEVDRAFEEAVTTDLLTGLFHSQRVALLNGSDPATAWVHRDGQPFPGRTPAADLPEYSTRRCVFNSNDSYWVPAPGVRLPRHTAMAGLSGVPLSPRSRMNARVIDGRGPSGVTDGNWDIETARQALFDNRSLLAEDLLEPIVNRLNSHGDLDLGNGWTAAAVGTLLAGWDRAFNIDSVGAVMFRELLGSFSDEELRASGRLWAEAFDPTRPEDTPTGLAAAGAGEDPLLTAVRLGLQALDQAGVAPDAPLGSVQFVDRSGQRIALHGANEVEGILNVVAPVGAFQRSDLEPSVEVGAPIAGRFERTGLRVGGYACTYGASFVMLVQFTDAGPEADCLLTYGQSGDPASPHHVDQMHAFAQLDFRRARFASADILASPVLSELAFDVARS